MSDIPDCRKCGWELTLDAGCVFWTCMNSECPNYLTRVIPAADDIDEAELRFGEPR